MLRLAVIAAAGVLLGVGLVLSPGGEHGARGARLRLYGELLPAGDEGADLAVARAEQQLAGWFNLELPDGTRRSIRYDELGIGLDRARFRRSIRDTARQGGRWSAAEAPAGASDAIDLSVPLLVDRTRALDVLLALKELIDQPAVDARLDLDSRAVVPERAGHRLDIDRSLVAIEEALQRGEVVASLTFQSEVPQRHARELADVRHDVLLGYFETTLGASPRAGERRFNLTLAASKLDGFVLMPGAVFDFNATVGPRDEARGYRVAAMAAAGELVDGSGSSTSLIAGTLHAAALFAGLEVVERHLPARPGWIELGLDAAVAYPSANLRLGNTYPFPVVLRATASDGRVRAEVRGPKRPHTISIVIQVDRVTPFEVIERADSTLERGARVVAQRGVPGVDLRRYRIRRDGAHAVRELLRESYPPTPELIHVGGDAASSIAKSSRIDVLASVAATTTGRPPHVTRMTERFADELVVISQSDDPSRPHVQQRQGARWTVPIWSKDIGEPTEDPPPRAAENAATRPGAGDFLNR